MIIRLALLGFLTTGTCAAAIVIPIELENGNPVAQVHINGMPARLIVDSGGELVSLKPPAIERLGATRSGSHASGTNALGDTRDQALLTLASLDVGGRTFRNVAAQEAGTYSADSAGDGVIGRQFLNQFVSVYDYDAHRISLFESNEREAVERECRGVSLRTLPDPEGLVVTKAKADRNEMRVLWDTGAMHSMLKKTFADDHRLLVETPFYTAQKFVLGGRNVGPLRFVVVDVRAPAGVDGYMGYNFFADHVVCVDPQGGVVRFRPNDETPP